MQVTKVPVSKPTVINVLIEKLENIPIAEQVSKKIFKLEDKNYFNRDNNLPVLPNSGGLKRRQDKKRCRMCRLPM